MSLFLYTNGHIAADGEYIPRTVTCATIQKTPYVITKEMSTREDRQTTEKWLKEKTQHIPCHYVKGSTQKKCFKEMGVINTIDLDTKFVFPIAYPQKMTKSNREYSMSLGKHYAKTIYNHLQPVLLH